MAWKFQKIQDIKDNVLNHDTKNLKAYNNALRKNIEPKLYVEYLVWHFDIYIDLTMIMVCAQNVYPNLTTEQIYDWVRDNIEGHQMIV